MSKIGAKPKQNKTLIAAQLRVLKSNVNAKNPKQKLSILELKKIQNENKKVNYTSTLTPEQLEDCFIKKQRELQPELSEYISIAQNGVISLKRVTGFLYGDKQILYEPNANVMQSGPPGQTTQTMNNATDTTALVEQRIPFKIIIMDKISAIQDTDKMTRQDSFNTKNNLTPEKSGKICATFLLNMYLNSKYVNIDKDEIRGKLITLDICNPDPTSIDWSKYIFLLMPGVYTDFSQQSLEMGNTGGTRSKKSKTKRRKHKSKRRKTNKRRRRR